MFYDHVNHQHGTRLESPLPKFRTNLLVVYVISVCVMMMGGSIKCVKYLLFLFNLLFAVRIFFSYSKVDRISSISRYWLNAEIPD